MPPFEIGGTWSGQSYTHTGDKTHPHKTKGHPQGCSPKTLSKDSLRLSPKKKEFTKPGEERKVGEVPAGLKKIRKDIENFPEK
ncbi:hypothetical protein ES705_44787 [subsurface metagenome]